MSIQNAMTPSNYVVENNWLFALHANPLLASHDMMLHQVSQVAVAMLVIAFGGGGRAWIRGAVPRRAQMVAPNSSDTTSSPVSASSGLAAGLECTAGVATAAVSLALALGSGSSDGYLFCLGRLV